MLSKITSLAMTDDQRHVGVKAEFEGIGISTNGSDSENISESDFGDQSQDFEFSS